MSFPVLSALASACVLLLSSVAPASAQESDPRELREKADDLESKAREFNAAGENERAQEAMRQAREARASAGNLWSSRGQSGGQERQRELQQKLQNSMAELKELRAAGKQHEAMEVKEGILKLQQELDRMGRPPGPGSRMAREVGPGDRGPGMDDRRPDVFRGAGNAEEMQRRLQHLQIAIDNLHAAGMHEPADQLARQADVIRQQLRTDAPRNPPPALRESEIDRLRAEIQELRGNIREMREQLGKLQGDRPTER